MHPHDLPCDPAIANSSTPDLPSMSPEPSSSIREQQQQSNHDRTDNGGDRTVRRQRPSRACTVRAAARLSEAAAAEAEAAAAERRHRSAATRKARERERERSPEPSPEPLTPQCKIITPLVESPEPSQLPRWSLRSMWQLASILNFLNVFRPVLNIKVEFSAEEFETALITPNNTLSDIHIPLLKAIPPITRTALGHNTWITVLCRKLRDWWHWVAEGELPIVASHGAEVEAYNGLDPAVRVVILKALCDIRVEQEDIRNYMDDAMKHGTQLSAFRKERVGGDSFGISYWYEDDPIIGHRLYREIRKVEVKKGKGKNVQPIPHSCYQWETVATNLDEFQNVSEKLFSSQNRTEASLGKKLKNDMLPEIEKVHKRKERLLKKQHREALLLDSMINMDGLATGRSLRDRKPVTYTFDDYDKSINEAIKITKYDDYDKSINEAIKITKRKHPSPEPNGNVRREFSAKPDVSINGRWTGPSQVPQQASFETLSPKSFDYDESDMDHKPENLDRSNRRRQRPQRYSAKEFVEAVSDNEADFDSDDDIVGEAVYDEEYLRQRKQRRRMSSSSEGDDEYHFDEENGEDEEEEYSLSISQDSDEPWKHKTLPGRTRRETKLKSVGELQSGLRRSNRATRNRINYRKYELSESEAESTKLDKSNASDERTDTDNAEFSMVSQDSESNNDYPEIKEVDQLAEEHPGTEQKEQDQPVAKSNSLGQVENEGLRKTRFLDLNELAPGSGLEDGPITTIKDENRDDF